MKLVLLAAGKGLRMRPLTLTTPKPLVVYRGKPALDHIFDVLPDLIDEVIIVISYLGGKIKMYCGETFYGRKIIYAQGEEKGTALDFLKSKPFIGEGERFAVAYADDILTSKEIIDCLGNEFSWLCYHMATPKDVGLVEVDEDGYVTSFAEKPDYSTSHLVADGFMVIDSSIFSYNPVLHEKGEYYFSDMMAQFCADHNVKAVVGDLNHGHLTSPEDIVKLNQTA